MENGKRRKVAPVLTSGELIGAAKEVTKDERVATGPPSSCIMLLMIDTNTMFCSCLSEIEFLPSACTQSAVLVEKNVSPRGQCPNGDQSDRRRCLRWHG